MAEEDIAPKLREKSESQTLAEKSRVIKLAFSAHNRHVSTGSVKETTTEGSMPNSKRIKIEVEAAAEYYFDETIMPLIKRKELLSFGNKYVLHL